LAYCLTHKLFYTQKCPRCQPRKKNLDGNGDPGAAPGYRSTDLTTRERVIQMLESSIANTNRANRSHHAVRIEQDELVVFYCPSQDQVTFAHAPLSPGLWGELLKTLNRNTSPETDQEIQAVIDAMQAWGGKMHSFRM
jgi:hypothetical protein